MNARLKQLKRIMLLVMIFGLFIFTIGQFVPIYFAYVDFRLYFYPIVLFITSIAVGVISYDSMYLPHKDNKIYSTIISLLTTGIVFLVFSFITVAKIIAVWSDTGPIYIKKSNTDIQIVSRYINEGAFGGGTEPGDYEIVVKRPFTPFFKIETAVDTTKIDKGEWKRL